MSGEDCPGWTAYVGECDSHCADRCVAQHGQQTYLGSWCWTNLYGTSYCIFYCIELYFSKYIVSFVGYWPMAGTTMPPTTAAAPPTPAEAEFVASQAPLVSSGVEPTMTPQTSPNSSGAEYVAPQAHPVSPRSAEPMTPPQAPSGGEPAETPQNPPYSKKVKKNKHDHPKKIHH
ncbi:hypothetical protein MKW94_020380 [Papaver nudicaule]|uniref:Uncharacterized protein n=1 Tax=Papaver nudicaule TaxID=74823 RepID=A0AA41W2B3_PAPNU|nr:hypothetical protein [Papaver nudicaule]